MIVKNINGTSGHICGCVSWLEHWKKFSKQSLLTSCPTKGCSNEIEVGAHVQENRALDQKWYIVPLCKECNAKIGDSLDIMDGIALVSASISETCG